MGLCFPLTCMGSEFVSECLCLWERVVTGSRSCVDVLRLSARVATEGRNVVCVACCAEVHGLPARAIESGCLPLTMSTVNNCYSLSV